MQFDRTGIILYTLCYEECVVFYEQVLELKRIFSTPELTCFAFGGSYLMVEKDDEFQGDMTNQERLRTCLRMNVPDVKELTNRLIEKGVKVDYQSHSWGTVAKFFDPDGNLCAFKDSEKFEEQIKKAQA